MTTIVWIHDPELDHWAVLRSADATGVVNTLCLRSFCPGPVRIRTSTTSPTDLNRPENTCPACEVELRAGTHGAAGVAVSRVTTQELGLRPLEAEIDPKKEWGA